MSAPATQPRPVLSFRAPEQVIDFHRLDSMVFSDTLADAPIIQQSIQRVMRDGRCTEDGATSLEFDAFNTLHKNKVAETGNGDMLHREILKRVRDDKGYHDLRQYTIGDQLASGLGTVSLVETTIKSLSEELKKKAEQQREAEERAKEQEQYAQLMHEDPDADPQDVQNAFEDAAKSRAQADKAGQQLKSQLMQSGKEIAQAVSQGVAKATGDAAAVGAAGSAFGLGSGDASNSMSVAEKFRLAKVVQSAGPAFAKLLKLIGRLKMEAAQKRTSRLQHDAGEIVDISIGSDVHSLIDDEIVAMFHPKFRTLAQARFLDDSMMQHEVEAKETLGRGDMVILLDESGSMGAATRSNYGDSTREHEAKAIAIALVHTAVREGRTAHVCFFQGDVTFEVTISPADMKTTTNGVNSAAEKLVSIAQRGTAGGTEFDKPLTRAAQIIRSGKADRADLVMLTDGDSSVSAKVLADLDALKAKHGVSIFTMLVGNDAASSTGVVAQFSTRVWKASSLLEASGDLFELV